VAIVLGSRFLVIAFVGKGAGYDCVLDQESYLYYMYFIFLGCVWVSVSHFIEIDDVFWFSLGLVEWYFFFRL